MDDRELLELAARAYWGDEIDDVCNIEWSEEDQAIAYTHADNQDHNGNDRTFLWSPLTDDGDALRLAVRLGIKVMPYPVYSPDKHSVEASRLALAPPTDDENTYVGPQLVERYGDDPCEATRRAITRAAAEIGKDMQAKENPR